MPAPARSFFPLTGIPEIKPGADLAATLIASIEATGPAPEAGDIVAIAQKIVSKAEDRFVDLNDIEPSAEARALAYSGEKDPRLAELILRESIRIVRDTSLVLITEHRLGIVLANAGIDRSNVNGSDNLVLLLPEDPDASAATIRKKLESHFGVPLGVIITDSVGRPWRLGTTCIAIGCAGVEAMNDMRGEQDSFGRVLQVAEVATADCIAGAAGLLMGEGSEKIPAVICRGFEAGESEQTARNILRPGNENLFR